MSRKNVNAKKTLRVFLAASSALVLLTAVSPLADASDKGKQGNNGQSNNGKGESHGKKGDKSAIDSILNAIQTSPVFNGKGKKFENDGNALEGQAKSLLKKLDKLGSSNPAVTVAVTSYINTVDTATATFQNAIKTAKTTYKSALATATTDSSKQSAETTYKGAIAAAQQNFNATIAAANLALKTVLTGLLPATQGALPSPSPSPSST